MPSSSTGPGAAQLLRSVGLLADGPGVWGRPIAAQGPGVFVIEWGSPVATAPVDVSRVGKWIERVETLQLDGARPTGKSLAARIASFWVPSQTVVYIGSSEVSVARRVAAMATTELGARRPYAGGHWLQTLRGLDGARIWWSLTPATEEYEDALFDAFAASVSETELAALPDREVVLPFANLRRSDGRRKATGLRGAIPVDPKEAPAPPTHVVVVPDGDAEGARGEPPEPRRRQAVPATTRPKATAPRKDRAPAAPPTPPAGTTQPDGLTVEGSARLQAELEHLTNVKRPEVIARIRTAKEHGDLKENAEYHAAREEQSFLEGRVQALEARLRDAVVVDAPAAGSGANLGSRVTVESDGLTDTYTLVSTAEANPSEGRVSTVSPIGQALLGAVPGAEVTVHTPRGPVRYRVTAVE